MSLTIPGPSAASNGASYKSNYRNIPQTCLDYCHYLGSGPPPQDVGRPGDIWECRHSQRAFAHSPMQADIRRSVPVRCEGWIEYQHTDVEYGLKGKTFIWHPTVERCLFRSPEKSVLSWSKSSSIKTMFSRGKQHFKKRMAGATPTVDLEPLLDASAIWAFANGPIVTSEDTSEDYAGVLPIQSNNTLVPANSEVFGTQMSSEATAAVFIALEGRSYYLPRFDPKSATASAPSHPRKKVKYTHGGSIYVDSEIPSLAQNRKDLTVLAAQARPATEDKTGFIELSYFDDNIVEKIDAALAVGKMVFVKQAQDHPPLHFDLTGARSLKGSTLAPVYVEDALVREENPDIDDTLTDTEIKMTLKDFVDAADQPNCCYYMFDRFGAHGRTPYFIRELDAHRNASASICEHSTALTQLNHLPHNSENLLACPVSGRYNEMSFTEWQTWSHAGFMTDEKKYADSRCSWMQVMDGEMLIFWFRWPDTRYNSRKEVKEFLAHGSCLQDPTLFSTYCVSLKRGYILIQPPNVPHVVYTPTKSVALGGSFFTYNTLHLTELSRQVIAIRMGNNAHRDSQRCILLEELDRMAIALDFYEGAIRRDSLKALVRMVSRGGDYLLEVDRHVIRDSNDFLRRRVKAMEVAGRTSNSVGASIEALVEEEHMANGTWRDLDGSLVTRSMWSA